MKPRIHAGRNGTSRRHELANARSHLISTIAGTIESCDLSQVQAAELCGTDQPTLSKVLRGRMESVTLDKLCAWALALGCTVEIRAAGPAVVARVPLEGLAHG
jgi:predicted XRE-type DNA-binding protein